jgi:ribosome biogenesis GTPase A
LLQSGGIPNIEEAARSVIRDYLNGKLTYFTTPPVVDDDDQDEEDVEMQ